MAGHFHNLSVIPISIMIVNAVIKVFQKACLEFTPEYKEDEVDQIKCFSTTLIEEKLQNEILIDNQNENNQEKIQNGILIDNQNEEIKKIYKIIIWKITKMKIL